MFSLFKKKSKPKPKPEHELMMESGEWRKKFHYFCTECHSSFDFLVLEKHDFCGFDEILECPCCGAKMHCFYVSSEADCYKHFYRPKGSKEDWTPPTK